MKRRSFFRMLAGLACVPLLPKVAAQKAPNLEFTVQGLGWTACRPYRPGDVVKVADELPVATVDNPGCLWMCRDDLPEPGYTIKADLSS